MFQCCLFKQKLFVDKIKFYEKCSPTVHLHVKNFFYNYTLDFCSDLSRVRLKKSDFVLLLYFSSLLYSSSLRL